MGLAALTPEQRQAMASKGGRTAASKPWHYRFTPEKAAEAGRKGGKAISANRRHMAEIGRRGGLMGRKDADAPWRQWTLDEVIHRIRQLHADGQDMTFCGIARHDKDLFMAARAHCGSWGQMIEAAGLNYRDIYRQGFVRRGQIAWTPQLILDELRRLYLHVEPGTLPTRPEPRLANIARVYFGSLWAAYTAAGVDYLGIRSRWTKRSVIEAIGLLAKSRPDITENEIQQTWPKLMNAVNRLFGSLQAARAAIP